MSEECKQRIFGGNSFHGHPCTRKAVKDGYCRQHHPDSVEERRKKSAQRWEDQWAARVAARKARARNLHYALIELGLPDDPVTNSKARELIESYVP